MSRDNGWLVTKRGVWIPVAHNASVTESLPWRRASFVSLGGTRRTVGRGRDPRTWEVMETVPYDWAQELYTLYMTEGSMEPMYFIPPLHASTNYAPFLNTGVKRDEFTRPDGTSGWQKMLPIGIDTDFFPVRPGMKLEFGGYQDGGKLQLRMFGLNFTEGAGTSSVDAISTAELASKTITVNSVNAAWAKLESVGQVNITQDRFVRMADLPMSGVRAYGAGGCWVTIDDLEISHKRLTKSGPIVDIEFTVTECERV